MIDATLRKKYTVEEIYLVMNTVFGHISNNDDYLNSEGILRLAGNEGSPKGIVPQGIVDDILAGNSIERKDRSEHEFITAMKYVLRSNMLVDKDDPIIKKFSANVKIYEGKAKEQNPLEELITDLIASEDLDKIYLAQIMYNYIKFSQVISAHTQQNKMSPKSAAIAGLSPVLANNVIQSGMTDLSKCQEIVENAIKSDSFDLSFTEKYSAQLRNVNYETLLENQIDKASAQVSMLATQVQQQKQTVQNNNQALASSKDYKSNKRIYLPDKYNEKYKSAKQHKVASESQLNASKATLDELTAKLEQAELRLANLQKIKISNKLPAPSKHKTKKKKAALSHRYNASKSKNKTKFAPFVDKLQTHIKAMNTIQPIDTHSKSIVKHHLERVIAATQNLNDAPPETVDNKVMVLLDELENARSYINTKPGITPHLQSSLALLDEIQSSLINKHPQSLMPPKTIAEIKSQMAMIKSLNNLDMHSKAVISRSLDNIIQSVENASSSKPEALPALLKALHKDIDEAIGLMSKRVDKVSDLHQSIDLLNKVKKQIPIPVELIKPKKPRNN